MPLRGRLQLKDQTTFFVTTSTKNHEKLFESDERKQDLLDLISERICHYKAELFGYVIMSNHFHLLIRIDDGGPKLVQLIRDVKSLSARKFFPGRKSIWQERFDDVAVYTEEQFRIKLNYIHYNPVKAGIVNEANEYRFSSAKDWSQEFENSIVKTSWN